MTRRQIAVMAACAIWLLLVAMDISGCQGQALQPRGTASPSPTSTPQAVPVTPMVPFDEGQVAQLASDQRPATFDHTPLRPLGTHREIRCMSCHGQGRSVNCEACHQTSTTHLPGIRGNCFTCHSLESWQSAKYDHKPTVDLGKQHDGLACGSCHEGGILAASTVKCQTCHSIPNGHAPGITDGCVQCHSPGGWKPAKVTHTQFALTGQHQSVPCASCHADGAYAGRPAACESCHAKPSGHIPGVSGSCVQCHSPNGWRPAAFGHTKFALAGGHQGVACANCHADGAYAGRPSTCESCHAKPSGHIPGVSGSCVQCHSPNGWKPANFNHSKFALAGGHTGVACASCHANGAYAGRPSACESCHAKLSGHIPGVSGGCVQCHNSGGWKPANFGHTSFALTGQHQGVACASCHANGAYAGRPSTCESCHAKPSGHIPGVSGSCVQCHSPNGWKPASFGHTQFALTGQHQSVACASCHADGAYAGRPSACESCHAKPSGHIPGVSGSCVQCHSPGGWKPATFSHTKFALTGGHQNVACASCHANGVYAGHASTCESCHAKPSGHIPGVSGSCVQCHSPGGWKPATFSHTKFALTGKHTGVACASCHANGVYAGHASTCESCHKTPAGHIPGITSGCVQCHSPNGWKPATFSHAKFALTGGHTGVACASCHSDGVYAGRPAACESCHAKPSGHIPGVSGSCVQCHSPGGWKPATFSHAKFALTGGHQSVACASCHANGVYVGHASSCESCHAKPSGHIPGVSGSCVQCHSPGGWKPATFSHTKFALTGGHTGVACASCHANGIYAGHASTCESCHAKPSGHIPGVSGSCVQCHSPGGWKPATFSHTKFALTGKHTGVACATCHKNGVYAGTSALCQSCHTPPGTHAGLNPACTSCHTPAGFKPSTFTHRSVGEHIGSSPERPLTCTTCHPSKFTDRNCLGSGCHKSTPRY